MPQVLSSPVSGIINNTGTDLFSYPNVSAPSILGLQTPSTQPLPPGTVTATNLLSPGMHVLQQLANFPGNVYDLSPDSLLVHFMAALLGDAGVGQLRKRQLVARLQQAITSTRFYDLDSFYGALFGAQRGPSGVLPTNPATGVAVSPYTGLASPDGWDEVEEADALYRERIIALAKAITLGATVPGMQALAEAITGVPCAVSEVWRLLDNAEGPAPGLQTWQQVTALYPAWSATGQQTWQQVEGYVSIAGLLGNDAPNEIVITPRLAYPGTPAGLAQQGSDMLGILSVVEVLKPAATIVSVNLGSDGITLPVSIASAWSPSQYWELVHVVTPSAPSSPAYAPIASSYQGATAASLPAGAYVTPSPPMSRSLGGIYSYAADITSVTSRAVTGSDPGQDVVTDGQDYQVVVFPGGGSASYPPAAAVASPQQAATARTASSVAVQAAPYSGPRVPVARAS